jgi:hypothetical protein
MISLLHTFKRLEEGRPFWILGQTQRILSFDLKRNGKPTWSFKPMERFVFPCLWETGKRWMAWMGDEIAKEVRGRRGSEKEDWGEGPKRFWLLDDPGTEEAIKIIISTSSKDGS